MSHHFDSPTAIEDGRIGLCDLYVFGGPAASTTLILTVNPDAGRSSPTTFRPDALYEFVIASDGGTTEDRALRLRFGEPEPGGRQRMAVRYAEGPDSRSGIDGHHLGTGETASLFRLDVPDGTGWAWFGPASDPFWGDGIALAQFQQEVSAGHIGPDTLAGARDNLFAGRNVTAAALQIPDVMLAGDNVSVWARVSLYGHAPQRQVSRMGNPMLRPLFFPQPGAEVEELNAGTPAEDFARHGDRVRRLAHTVAKLRGQPDPDAHAAAVAHAFLPDQLRYRPGALAGYHPGTGNGRHPHDDAFGIAVTVLNGAPLGGSPSPHAEVADFPHLAPADHSNLPALADLFGLRQHRPETTHTQ